MKTSLLERLARRYQTPKQVQKFLRSLDYNHEERGETLRSAQGALAAGKAHCFEAAFIAAALLEQNGYPPLVLSLDSVDDLDHVLAVFQEKGKWGAIGRSRDDCLHGRPPLYRSLRDLAWSYFDAYIDKTGRLQGYRLFALDEAGVDWRAGRQNLWAVDKYRIGLKHTKMISSERRYQRVLRRYLRKGPWARDPLWW